METKSLVYVYPLLRRSAIIVLGKNDQFLLLGNIYIEGIVGTSKIPTFF